jgi:DNA-binding response OmpR family regulator
MSDARERPSARPRILVVEDEAKTAAALRLYLEHAGFEARVAATGTQGLAEARTDAYALVLLDILLPGIDGLAICRALRSESDVPVILLTARTTESDRLEGLGLGADDYVTKPFSPREVVARVRAVLRRSRRAQDRGPAEIRTRSLVVDRATRSVLVRGRPARLTPAEFELLAALAAAPERVFTRSELAERAFGEDYAGLERTIDAHVMRLRRKIEDPARPALVVTVFGVGYKLADV